MQTLCFSIGLLLLVGTSCAENAKTPSTASAGSVCNSGLKGDFAYKTCATFCKAEKNIRGHCKYCMPHVLA